LLAQGYEFAWFDGLNRFYVAQERRDRLEAFRVPVNINDGFRDATILSLEQKLEQLRIRHGFSPAPALALISEVPISSQVDDAAGLLRVVQAQATELSRLRRGLVAAQALAEQRLEMIAAVAEAPRAPGTAPVTDLEIPQQVLRQLQADIDDIVRRSRWRRLGRRLRLAKPTDWEQADWAPDPTLLAPGLLATAQDEQRLAAEITRLAQHRGDLGRSRWRRLGQRIGLAKRLPWEDQPASIEPPVMASKLGTSAEAPPVVAQSSGYAALIEYTTGRFFAECRRAAVDVVLDVGANAGQFGAGLRSMGYAGHIISFEPLSEAHAALTARAEADPLWSIAPRCAVGAQEGEATIHVAGNSYSSSLLPMLQRHLSAAPESGYVDQEHCAVVSLDDFIDRTFTDRSTSIGLKIDTQGFEAEVLKGLERNIGRVEVVLCEMSLTPLYDGAPAMLDLCAQLAALGFRCIALGPEFADPRNGVLLQVDGVFVRAPASAASAG
jgi:FkbM family methyltransferase